MFLKLWGMSYKRLGNYIRQVNVRNRDLETEVLLGVSITKKLIPSIANVIGTDMSVYKIIEKRQFAYGTVTSRNGEKISIALSDQYDKALVSQIYVVFEVIDTEELLPEYLMMWFSRPEFDRYVRFHSHGSTRETFDWADMCEVELPIPSIEEQRQIVAQYQSIANKIKVNEQICEKLEATAQALYKHWFVDFEFPNEEGKPYKSSGGKMVWNEELGKDIPEGWEVKRLGEVSNCLDFKRRPLSQEERAEKIGNIPYYGAMSIVGYVDEYLYDGDFLLLSEDGANIIDENGYPAIQYVWGRFWLNNHSHIIEGKDFITIQFLYNALLKTNVSDLVTGAAQPKINQQNMNSITILTGTENIHKNFDSLIDKNYTLTKIYKDQNQKLTQLQSLLLSRLAVGEEEKRKIMV